MHSYRTVFENCNHFMLTDSQIVGINQSSKKTTFHWFFWRLIILYKPPWKYQLKISLIFWLFFIPYKLITTVFISSILYDNRPKKFWADPQDNYSNYHKKRIMAWCRRTWTRSSWVSKISCSMKKFCKKSNFSRPR